MDEDISKSAEKQLMTMNKNHNNIWDCIRGIACLLVAFYHYSYQYGEKIGHVEDWKIVSHYGGPAGVCLFFLLTGMFLIPSLKSCQNGGGYLTNRITRLYPSLFVSVLITAIVLHLRKGVSYDFFTVLTNMTMTSSFFGYPYIDGAYWTLSIQLIIYVASCFIFFVLSKRKEDVFFNFMAIWLFVAFIWQIVHRLTGFNSLGYLLIVNYIQVFFQGVLIYYISEHKEKIKKLLPLVVASLSYSLFVSVQYFIINSILFIVIFIIMFMGVQYNGKTLLTFIGSVSYAFYLLHQEIGYAIISLLESLGWTNEWIILIPIASILLIAFIITKFVELPIRKLITNKSV